MFSEEFTYTKGERIAEVISTVLAVGFDGAYIALMVLGKISGFGILFIIVSSIVYGAFTLGSKAPQFTSNALADKEISEDKIRLIRRGCIATKIAVMCVLFVLTITGIIFGGR
ncbi:MAG: hypothetical protein K2N06_01725 [Oscillospiraceae bacterium]|nr:hypothetical protein [Oscillospiraceae bacterium]